MNDDLDGDEAMKNLENLTRKVFEKRPDDETEIIEEQQDDEVADD